MRTRYCESNTDDVKNWAYLLVSASIINCGQKAQVRIQGGGPGGPGPPLTLGFEAPKLSIFGPYLIFL